MSSFKAVRIRQIQFVPSTEGFFSFLVRSCVGENRSPPQDEILIRRPQ